MKPTNSFKHPKCSVVIPTHNCLNFLKDAIESVKQQSLMNLEIIVVDDNSNDGTWRWLQQQILSDQRLRPFRVTAKSPAKARNFGVQKAKGEWVAFLDADDIWLSDKLRRQLAFHQANPDIHFSFSDYRHIDMDGKDLGTCFEYWSHNQEPGSEPLSYRPLAQGAAKLFAQNIVGTSTVMVKRETLLDVDGFDEKLKSAEDWDLWLKLALSGKVGVGNFCDTLYLMRPESESSKKESRIQAMQLIFERYRRARACASLTALRTARSRISVAEAEKWLNLKKPARAFWAHAWAMLLTPSLRALKETVNDARLWLSSQTSF